MHDSMDVFTFVKFAQHLNIKLSGELYHILVSGEYEKRFSYTFPVFKHQKHKDQKIQELFETLDGLKYYNCNLKPTKGDRDAQYWKWCKDKMFYVSAIAQGKIACRYDSQTTD
uniref:Uncharacterized protein n=1 Tax=Panagrolaimus superbus TaxID=310955 RepID=A0A914Y2N2_9BILA